jgi:restriction system protein
MSGLPWDNNSWQVAAEIAVRHSRRDASMSLVGASMKMEAGNLSAQTRNNFQGASANVEAGSFSATKEEKLPQLLMQTIIVPGDKTTEGRLIRAVALPWFDIIEVLQRDKNAAFTIPPEKWEEIIAGAYKKAGFDEVTLTPRSGDLGRDVIAIKKGLASVRVIDQVKAFAPTNLVTANDVRALMGVLQTDGASKGFLTTTSNFAPKIATDPLIQPLIPSRLELINGSMLLARLGELAGEKKDGDVD